MTNLAGLCHLAVNHLTTKRQDSKNHSAHPRMVCAAAGDLYRSPFGSLGDEYCDLKRRPPFGFGLFFDLLPEQCSFLLGHNGYLVSNGKHRVFECT